MKCHPMFTYSLYEETNCGINDRLPTLATHLSTIESKVRGTVAEGALSEGHANILADEPILQPILELFTASIAAIAGVKIAQVLCVRSWCFTARASEYVFFDHKQWWSHSQPSDKTGLHNHLPYHFTGVYYVAVGPGTPEPIQFLNPIPSGFGQCDWFPWSPREDSILIFGSHLWHRVPPLQSTAADRISLSMDALVMA